LKKAWRPDFFLFDLTSQKTGLVEGATISFKTRKEEEKAEKGPL